MLARHLESHLAVIRDTVHECGPAIDQITGDLIACMRRNNKILLCGNGGSAADAQHVAGEFINRFRYDRPPLPAMALTVDSSVLTCIGNDADFSQVFSKQVLALGNEGDVLCAISTSGRSKNVLAAIEAAKQRGVRTIGFTGKAGGECLGPLCDYCLAIPSNDTPRIQEAHLFAWHVICEAVEAALWPSYAPAPRP